MIQRSTLLLPFLLFLGTANAQTPTGPEQLPGYRFASEVGLLSRQPAHTSAARDHAPRPLDPYAELARKCGITPRSGAEKVIYEFHDPLTGTGYVIPMASVGDDAGNTYVTGVTTSEAGPGGHHFTLKLGTDGAVLWEAVEPVTTYAAEMGYEIMLAPSGEVVVAGSYWNGTDMDLRVRQYTTAGALVWESTYAGTGDGLDLPTALTTDVDGNILVAAMSWSGTSIDYVTAKFSATGDALWAMRDNGAGGDRWNEPTAIATDADGNVYVTGFSENADYWAGYYTIKYDADGTELWQQRYTHIGLVDEGDPGGPTTQTNSLARAITVDASGMVYVTGTFYHGLSRIGTIAYNAAGEQQWIESYRSGQEMTDGRTIARGPGDLLYVGGERNGSFSEDGFVLVGYSTTGDSLWAAETDDLIEITAEHLELDVDGNAVLGGIASLLVDEENFIMVQVARASAFGPDGAPIAETTYQQIQADTATFMGLGGMDVGSDGSITFTVHAFYSAQGGVLQAARFPVGATEESWATVERDVHAGRGSMLNGFPDAFGNSFCTGEYLRFNDGVSTTRFVVKHGPDGAILWDVEYNAENGHPANGIAATVDEEGDLRVLLLPEDDFSGTPLTLRLKRISADGAEVWEAQKELALPALYSIVTDADGNTYLAGTAKPTGGTHGVFVVVKFSADGEELWTTFHEVAGANRYGAGQARVTPEGDLLLPGGAGTGSFFSEELVYTITKFRANGTVAWSTPVEVPDVSAGAVDVLTAPNGDIYATGHLADLSTGFTDMMVAKLSSAGAVQWHERRGEAQRDERTYTLKQLSTGDIVVIGYSLALNGDIHNELVRYDGEGNEVWVAESPNMRFWYDLYVDLNDNSYILNQVITSPFPYRLYGAPFASAGLLRVDADGNVVDEDFHTGPELSEFFPDRLLAHGDGRLVLAGTLRNESFYEGVFLFGSDMELPVAVDGPDPAVPSSVGHSYPSPANTIAYVPITLQQATSVRIEVLDVQGRLVKAIAPRQFATGQHALPVPVSDLVTGHYTYHVITDGGRWAGRLSVHH